MKVLVTGAPLPGQDRLYLVRCPKCGEKVRIGRTREASGHPRRTGEQPDRILDHCPYCHTYIELAPATEMRA